MPTIKQLEALLAKEPNDAFLHFGLAMAQWKDHRIKEALASFDRALEIDPRNVAAYFQKGRAQAEASRIDDAQRTLIQGIAVAKEVGDDHAAREMMEYLDAL